MPCNKLITILPEYKYLQTNYKKICPPRVNSCPQLNLISFPASYVKSHKTKEKELYELVVA